MRKLKREAGKRIFVRCYNRQGQMIYEKDERYEIDARRSASELIINNPVVVSVSVDHDDA